MDRTAGRKGWLFLQMPVTRKTKYQNYFHSIKKLYFIIIKVLEFWLLHPFGEGGKTPPGPKSQHSCETAAQKCHNHTLLPWDEDDWSCRCVPCWLEARCSISGLQDSRERREETAILSRQQSACICAKHMLGVVGSTDSRLSFEKRQQQEKHWTQLVTALPVPCIQVNTEPVWIHLQRKGRWNLPQDPAERISCQFLTQQKYKVLDAPTESAEFCWEDKDSSCWNLTPRYRSGEQNVDAREMDGLWAQELLAITSPLPSCRQLNSKELSPLFPVPTLSLFQPTDCCTWALSPKQMEEMQAWLQKMKW